MSPDEFCDLPMIALCTIPKAWLLMTGYGTSKHNHRTSSAEGKSSVRTAAGPHAIRVTPISIFVRIRSRGLVHAQRYYKTLRTGLACPPPPPKKHMTPPAEALQMAYDARATAYFMGAPPPHTTPSCPIAYIIGLKWCRWLFSGGCCARQLLLTPCLDRSRRSFTQIRLFLDDPGRGELLSFDARGGVGTLCLCAPL